jgi:hypothetical protein
MQGARLVGDDRGFSDLQFETPWCESGLQKGLGHALGQARLAQLHGGEVDGHGQSVTPAGRLLTGLPQHPLAKRQDLAGFFSNGNEDVRGDQAALWVGPAQQSFIAVYPVVLERTLRLVEDRHLTARGGARRSAASCRRSRACSSMPFS